MNDEPLSTVPHCNPISKSNAATRRPSSIQTLQAAPSGSELNAVVIEFFRALSQGDFERLQRGFARSAMAVDRHGNQTQLSARWATRIARFDYRLTAQAPPFWPLDLVIVEQQDDRASTVVALLKPQDSSRLVFVPLTKTEYQGQTLFGDSLWFQLDQEEQDYRISAILEDFAMGP